MAEWGRVLETCGIRALHVFVSARVGERPLPTIEDAKTSTAYSAEDIAELQIQTRYFGKANFWRAVLHLPIILMFANSEAWRFTFLFVTMVVFHSFLILIELYKASVIRNLKPGEGGERPKFADQKPVSWGDWYFSPKPWESEKAYARMGIKFFRWQVTYFMERAMLTKEQRKSGLKAEYVGGGGRAEVLRFESSTRVAEVVHLGMGAIDILPVIFVIQHQIWLMLPYVLWICYGDFGLAILQRSHRLRVWKLVERMRAKHAKAEEAKTKEEVSV
jgi:hypothetical protein